MIMKIFFLLLALLIPFSSFATSAGPSEAAVHQEALANTQRVLTTESERQKIMATDPKARAADRAVIETVGSGKERDELYKIAAEYMKTLSEGNGGDVTKMNEAMQKASSDPAAFLKSMPPSMQQRIREIASDIEAKQKAPKPIPRP